MRYARHCYDHLAGRLGVALADALVADGTLSGDFAVERSTTLEVLGIEPCHARACRDWTEQRDHIAGPLGTALLSRFLELGWLQQSPNTRALRVTDPGRQAFLETLGVEPSATRARLPRAPARRALTARSAPETALSGARSSFPARRR